jgi:hypothetical protein
MQSTQPYTALPALALTPALSAPTPVSSPALAPSPSPAPALASALVNGNGSGSGAGNGNANASPYAGPYTSPYARAAASRAADMVDARRLGASRIAAAGAAMRTAAWRRLDASVLPQTLAVGDAVRVSLLALPVVQRLVKSQLVGDPLPLFSTSLFRVRRVIESAGRALYDVECTSCEGEDPLPAVINYSFAQLPARLNKVERRYLLRVLTGTRGTMGRIQPALLPVVWARPLVFDAAGLGSVGTLDSAGNLGIVG